MQKVGLEVEEVVGLDNVWAALAAEHAGEKGFHGRWSGPCAHHGVGNLQHRNKKISFWNREALLLNMRNEVVLHHVDQHSIFHRGL